MFRNRRWKLALVFLLLFGLSLFLNYRANPAPEASWIDRVSYRITSPVSKNLRKAWDWLENKVQVLFQASQLQAENQALNQEKQSLQQQVIFLEEFKNQVLRVDDHYQKLGIQPAQALAAQVVSFDIRALNQSLIINVGTAEGVQINQTVTANGGLVGRIIKVAPHYAQVLLINDPRSRVDILEKESRARGTLVGKKKSLRFNNQYYSTQADYFAADAPLKEGQLLITTGQDALFPKGIPVGTLKKIQREPRGLFWQAEVEPMAHLSSLEEVLVLKNNLIEDYELFNRTKTN